MKKLLALGTCLLAFAASPAVAQKGGPDVVLVRFERNGVGNLRVAVTRGEGKTELAEAKAGYSKDGSTQASEAEYKVLHQLYQEGYVLTSSATEGGGSFNWVFTKGH